MRKYDYRILLNLVTSFLALSMAGCTHFPARATSQLNQPGVKLEGANIVVIKAAPLKSIQQVTLAQEWAETQVVSATQKLAEIWAGRGVQVKVMTISSQEKAKTMLAGKMLQLEVVRHSKEVSTSSAGRFETLIGFNVLMMIFDLSLPNNPVWAGEMAIPASKRDDPVGFIVSELDGLLIKDKLVPGKL